MGFQNSRWSAPEGQFAVRITTDDQKIRGWLQNTVVVEPGTVAYVVQEGDYLGELPAGAYTIKSFEEKLEFWRKGQTTIILARGEVIPFDVPCPGVLTADSLFADLKVRVAIQIADISRFLDNLLGSRNELPLEMLKDRLIPRIQQAVSQATASRTMEQLKTPAIAQELSENVRDAVAISFQRYGLSFLEVETVAVAQAGFEEYLKKKGKQNLETAEAISDTKKMRDDLEVMRNRVGIRQQLRDAVTSDKMDTINNKQEMSQFLLEINKGKLIRQEELDQLVEGFEERKEDRQDLRNHLISLLELQREQEIDGLREEISHGMKVRAINSERELAELAGESANLEWRRELQQEIEAAEHHNQQQKSHLQAKWDRIREQNRQRRDDSWDQLVHQQRMEELRAGVEVAETERKSRVAILEQELAARLDQQKLDMEKRRKEWELEVADRESTSQFDRLKMVQEMNLQMQERQKKMELEMQELTADKGHQREMERLDTVGRLGTDALIATANSDNASVLADLKKHESGAANLNEMNEERLRMYEKMNETEKAKADAIAQAYKDAMQSQQTTVQQAITGISQASTPASPMMPPPMTPIPSAPTAEIWHVSLGGGQQSPPLQIAQVHQYISSGQVNATTPVWKTGMTDWMPAGQIPELAPYLGSGSSAPPPMASGPPGPPPS